MKGIFVTFEGPDGGGKSTQLQLLKQFIEEKKLPLVVTREPGGTEISDEIRHLLLNPKFTAMEATTEVLLYASSRAQHVLEKIKPALEAGYIVLCDRFVDASIAYQGYGLQIGEDVIRQINQFATGSLAPDRTYLVDIPVEEAMYRLQNQRNEEEFDQSLDRIEQREWDYHRKVRHGFHELAQQEKRIVMIDGTQKVNIIHQQIANDFEQLLAEYVK